MKTKLIPTLGAALLIGLSQVAAADIVTKKTTTTTSSGTVTQFSPSIVSIKTESSTEPQSYSYSKSTTVVDQNGAPYDVTTLNSGSSVDIDYVTEADSNVARKITVRKETTSDDGLTQKRETTEETTTRY